MPLQRNLWIAVLTILPLTTIHAQSTVQTGVRPSGRWAIRNATIVDGNGTPAAGPYDIIIEGNTIAEIVGLDPVALKAGRARRPQADREIDATGKYVLPGLINLHGHVQEERGGIPQPLEYELKLWLANGVTTVRDVGSETRKTIDLRARSAAGTVAAPRLFVYALFSGGGDAVSTQGIRTPEDARARVRELKTLGADGIKIVGIDRDLMQAMLDEAHKAGLKVAHHVGVEETTAWDDIKFGTTSIEHWYGVPDAALSGSQNFPTGYNYWNELDRFRYAGLLWSEADRHPEKLSEVLDLMIRNGTNWNPTMSVYEDNRDLWRAAGLPVKETLVHPNEIAAGPDSGTHGAFKTEWKTSDEINWKKNFAIWMRWVKTFHERGGVLTAGSDDGGIGGIGMIRELELMQEAGIHPIDVIKVATTNAYRALGMKEHCGVRVGCRADLAVVNGNPIDNLKVMYGRGYGFYGIVPRNEQWKHGGVAWTIRDGVLFDAQALLREAEWYVEQEKARVKTTSASSP